MQQSVTPPTRYTLAERAAAWNAIGVLLFLGVFIVLAVVDIGFGRNISMDLLASLAGAAGLLAFLAVPLMVWVALSRNRRDRESPRQPDGESVA